MTNGKTQASIYEEYDKLADFITINFQDHVADNPDMSAVDLAILLLMEYRELNFNIEGASGK